MKLDEQDKKAFTELKSVLNDWRSDNDWDWYDMLSPLQECVKYAETNAGLEDFGGM